MPESTCKMAERHAQLQLIGICCPDISRPQRVDMNEFKLTELIVAVSLV